VHHGGGEPVLRTLGLARLAGGRAGGAATLLPARAGGAAPTTIAALTRVAAASRGVPESPATEITAAGAAALAAARATPLPGATTMAVERPAPKGSAAATAASASSVFLLRLPGGLPRLRGTGGIAAGSLALFWLPSGRPRLRPLDSSAAPAPVPLEASSDDIGAKGGRDGGDRLAR
jgi:hypothetical protein